MKIARLQILLSLLVPVLIVGCGGKTSKTTDTKSAVFSTLGEKQEFLEKYVTFRREYEELEFAVSYIDGGSGRVPGPTEWDIRVMAKVPEAAIGEWNVGMTEVGQADTGWVYSIPKAPTDLDGFRWYRDGQRLVGIAPEERLVLYRSVAN